MLPPIVSSVAILIPTFGRVQRLATVVENAVQTSPDANVYLIMEPEEVCDVPGAETVSRKDGYRSYAAAINAAYKLTTEPYLFAAADDLRFHPGWLERALQEDALVVGTNDLGNPDVLAEEHATHYLVDRKYLDDVGGVYDEGPGSFLFEGYDHNWTDREFIETAKARGVFRPCLESVVEHMHYVFGKGVLDTTYEASFKNMWQDQELYASRQTAFAA